jgi:hypothetical protein
VPRTRKNLFSVSNSESPAKPEQLTGNFQGIGKSKPTFFQALENLMEFYQRPGKFRPKTSKAWKIIS